MKDIFFYPLVVLGLVAVYLLAHFAFIKPRKTKAEKKAWKPKEDINETAEKVLKDIERRQKTKE